MQKKRLPHCVVQSRAAKSVRDDAGTIRGAVEEVAAFVSALAPRSSERRGSMLEPRAHSIAGFRFAICSTSSSSVAKPMKYRQTIS